MLRSVVVLGCCCPERRAKVMSPSLSSALLLHLQGENQVNSISSSSSPRPPAKLKPSLLPSCSEPPASQNLSRLHGARPAHDQVGHPPSVPDRGEPADQEEPAGALRQLHPHPDLPAPHLHHRPAEQLRSRRPSEDRRAGMWTSPPYVSQILSDNPNVEI